MTDTVYLTPTEWQAMAQGIDFSGLSEDQMAALIARASAAAESEAGLPLGGSWLVTEYVNEDHRWRDTGRVYLYNWPVVEIGATRIRVGAQTTATIQGTEIYISQKGHYIEVSTLALAFGITPAIVSLGLREPQIEVDYTAGYDVIPDDLKTAIAIIASAQYLNKKMFEEGTAGVVSFTIGSYQVSFAQRGSAGSATGGVAGFANFVPDEAKAILRSYKNAPFLR